MLLRLGFSIRIINMDRICPWLICRDFKIFLIFSVHGKKSRSTRDSSGFGNVWATGCTHVCANWHGWFSSQTPHWCWKLGLVGAQWCCDLPKYNHSTTGWCLHQWQALVAREWEPFQPGPTTPELAMVVFDYITWWCFLTIYFLYIMDVSRSVRLFKYRRLTTALYSTESIFTPYPALAHVKDKPLRVQDCKLQHDLLRHVCNHNLLR